MASEQKRPDVRQARHIWITRRQPFMRNLLPRLDFTDETSVKTNMAKTTGWSPKGERLIDCAPFGHWNTQTVMAALRHDRLDAPWVIGGAMNRALFDLYAETPLIPTLQPGDVIFLDNLAAHHSPTAAATMREIGAWFVFGEGRPLDACLIPQAPAGLQPRPEPHRDGLCQAQGPDPTRRSTTL
ncbi:MAG: transposase [Alkalilacustris sp.]